MRITHTLSHSHSLTLNYFLFWFSFFAGAWYFLFCFIWYSHPSRSDTTLTTLTTQQFPIWYLKWVAWSMYSNWMASRWHSLGWALSLNLSFRLSLEILCVLGRTTKPSNSRWTPQGSWGLVPSKESLRVAIELTASCPYVASTASFMESFRMSMSFASAIGLLGPRKRLWRQ